MRPIAPLLAAGVALAALTACSSTPPAPTATTTVTVQAAVETVMVDGPASTTITLPAVTKTVVAQPPAPKAAIDPGTWTVGVDIAPGTYRTIEPVTDGCYWKISRSGTNGDDIVANDLPTGGRPTVTLRKGQDFDSHDCGSWAKR